ncbi:MAG TPA: hypothetical protein VIO61_09560 [Anaerolineaceae bacterium]
MSLLDLVVFPIQIENGQEAAELPGLVVATAPRRGTARLRTADRLVMLLTQAGNGNLTSIELQEYLQQAGEAYFRSSGAVTAGLRSAIQNLNEVLLERNVRRNRDGIRTYALLNMVVFHGDMVYLAHSGATHTLYCGENELRDFFDDQGSGRGLGLGRMISPRFYQSRVVDGDCFILAPEILPDWTSLDPNMVRKSTLDHLRKRLIGDNPPDDYSAGVVKLQAGKGSIHLLRPRLSSSPKVESTSTKIALDHPVPVPVPETVDVSPVIQDQQYPETTPVQAVPVQEQEDAVVPQVDEPLPDADTRYESTDSIKEAPAWLAEFQAGDELPGVVEDSFQEKIETDEQIPVTDISQELPGITQPQSQDSPGDTVVGVLLNGEKVVVPQEQPNLAARQRRGRTSREENPAIVSRRAHPVSSHRTPSITGQPPLPFAQPEEIEEGKTDFLDQVRNAIFRWVGSVKKQGGKLDNSGQPGHSQPQVDSSPKKPSSSSTFEYKFKTGLLRLFQAVGRSMQMAGVGIKTAASRALPGVMPGLSTGLMIFIAIAVPVIVVAVATTVYIQSGRGQQHMDYVQRAEQLAAAANGQKDPNVLRTVWEQVLQTLNQADVYGSSDRSKQLRLQAVQELDRIDSVVRVPFYPAFSGGFDKSINITRMAAGNSEVFLLDSSRGRIIRIFRAGQGYEIDTKFNCGPAVIGSVQVGPLIDLAILPLNNPVNASVMGSDANGNLIYCTSSSALITAKSLIPPRNGWRKLMGFSMYQSSIYLIDQQTNAVWRYDSGSKEEGAYGGEPRLFFGKEVPYLGDVIDLEMYNQDLYMLKSDGGIMLCTAGVEAVSQTRCTNPAKLGDPRPGRDPNPQSILDAHFTQIQVSRPPDPTLYLLDDSSTAIYAFSLRLNLISLYRPRLDMDVAIPSRKPTAFALNPARVAFLAFGNQIFFGQIP